MANRLFKDDQKSNIIIKPEELPTSKIIEMPNFPQTEAISEEELLAAPVDPSELNETPESKRYHKGWCCQIKDFRMFLEYGYMVG